MVQTHALNTTYECAMSTAVQHILTAQIDTSKQGRVCSLLACTPGCLLLGRAAGECLWLMPHWAEPQVWKLQIHLAGSWPAALVPAQHMGAG